MGDTLEDETLSINAIYEPDTLVHEPVSNAYILKIPSSHTALRVSFPLSYPDEPPTIIGPESTGLLARKGSANEIVALAQQVLTECFRPGEPCVFELIEQMIARLLQDIQNDVQGETADELAKDKHDMTDSPPEDAELTVQPQWTLSEVITEKKSVFLARAARVAHPEEAKAFVQHLVSTDKKVAKATHNITAWRISAPGSAGDVAYQDCDDDGENAAGGRLLHLLQIMDTWDVVVVVSRWFGGIHLGPDRFRCISNAARDALIKGGFDQSQPPPHAHPKPK